MNQPIQAVTFQHGGQTLFAAATPLLFGTDGNEGEMQIALSRAWKEGPKGEPVALGPDVFNAWIEKFKASGNAEIPIDRDHLTFHKTNPDSKAMGWITDLFVRMGAAGAELWSKVRWTPATATAIKAGEWKFCSPAFKLDATDAETGKPCGPKLFNVALTNLPFQEGLAPITLSAFDPTADDKAPPADDKPAPDAAATDKPDAMAADDKAPPASDAKGSDAPDANAQDAQLTTFIEACMKAGGLDRATVVSMLLEQADSIGSQLAQLAERDAAKTENTTMSLATSTTTEPTEAEKVAAKAKADAEAADKLELKILREQVTMLSQQVTDVQTTSQTAAEKAAADKAAAIALEVDGLIATGHVRDVGRDDAIQLFALDADRARRVYAEKVVPIGFSQAGTGDTESKPVGAVDPETVTYATLDPALRPLCMATADAWGDARKPERLDHWAKSIARSHAIRVGGGSTN